MAEDHLGAASANVDHQARCRRWLQLRHAGVDQSRLFTPGYHFDGKAQDGLGATQELIPIARLAQGLCRHGAHPNRLEALQLAGKGSQAVQRALHRDLVQAVVGAEASTQTYGLLQVLVPAVVAALELTDLEPKAVRPHVDRGQRSIGGGRQRAHGGHRSRHPGQERAAGYSCSS